MTSGCDILYVITDLEIGGVPLHLFRLATAMRDRGKRVLVVSLAPPGPVGERLRGADVDVLSCEAAGGRDVRVFPRLARILRRVRPRLVHALLFHANLAAKVAARLARHPRERVLCEIQTVEIERRWHLIVDRWSQGWCRATIGNSPSVVEHLARAARIPAEKLRLVRGGVDVEALAQAPAADRSALGLGPADRIVLWAGRLDPIKGIDVLFRAFARVSAEVPEAVLLLAGDGALRGALTAQASALGIAERTRFLGVRRDVPSLMKIAEAFVFPSRTEGLPNAILEAFACGCPVVTTDAPGCRDLVISGVTGLGTRVDDEAGLAEAVIRMMSDKSLASSLAAAARKEVSSFWHFSRTIEAYDRVYAEPHA
ncbi:MAG: D-inositol-3-phosphate glycosyltransferase [Phycisphaerae bacterium]|nr:D-inositol-3-phosphate glycosyltransferase [Phycisphaerae bacterium]